MLFHTYQLRRRGFRIGSIGLAARPPRLGHLIYDVSPFDYGRPVKLARLLTDGGKDILPPLENARIRVRKAIVVTGVEKIYASTKDHGTAFRQSWLCVLQRIDFSQDEDHQELMVKIASMAIIPPHE